MRSFLWASRRCFMHSLATPLDRLSGLELIRLLEHFNTTKTKCLPEPFLYDIQARIQSLEAAALPSQSLLTLTNFLVQHVSQINLEHDKLLDLFLPICQALEEHMPHLTVTELSKLLRMASQGLSASKAEAFRGFTETANGGLNIIAICLSQNSAGGKQYILALFNELRSRIVHSQATAGLLTTGFVFSLHCLSHCMQEPEVYASLTSLIKMVDHYSSAGGLTAQQLYLLLTSYYQTNILNLSFLRDIEPLYTVLEGIRQKVIEALDCDKNYPPEGAASSSQTAKQQKISGTSLPLSFQQYVSLLKLFGSDITLQRRKAFCERALERLHEETPLGIPFTAELLLDFVVLRAQAKIKTLDSDGPLLFLLQSKLEQLSTLDICKCYEKLMETGSSSAPLVDRMEFFVFSRAQQSDELFHMTNTELMHIVHFATSIPLKRKGLYHRLREVLLAPSAEDPPVSLGKECTTSTAALLGVHPTRLATLHLDQRLKLLVAWCRNKLVDPLLFDEISGLCQNDLKQSGPIKLKTVISTLSSCATVGYRNDILFDFLQRHIKAANVEKLTVFELFRISEAGRLLGMEFPGVNDRLRVIFPSQVRKKPWRQIYDIHFPLSFNLLLSSIVSTIRQTGCVPRRIT